ncbi:PAS domain-containing protein [Haematococcus lacustris]|uniref:PAS domain-containing protein n=1 Tax=Haematococcus lacustris TaxID=44745 RepID=A0A699YAX9_HAELA|nr:PAS domain-containing protein [Haematococcus lacustris]
MEEAFCIANCHVDHKFTDKVKVHISVRLGAVGTQHFHELSFQRVKAKPNVFDSRLFFACRSGLSTCLLNHNPAGPKLLPFKLEMKRKEAGGDSLHTVSLLSTSLDTALDERRLKLRVNTDGYVTSVGKSGVHLFGFEPQELLGCHLTTFLDILRPSGLAPAHPKPAASPAPAAAEAYLGVWV